MTLPVLTGVAGIAARYDLFILDVWGVVHDSLKPYPGVVDALARLRADGRTVALLSNAPRPNDNVAAQLADIGIAEGTYDLLLTSGEAARTALLNRPDPWHASLGAHGFHLGPARNQPTIDGLALVDDPAAADYIICTGFYDDETETAEDYRAMLQPAVERGLKLVCANPDIVVMRGDQMIPCAGALAALYEDLGGEVYRHGKPFHGVYDLLLERAGCTERSRAVMVGDGFPTDIRGARMNGLDSIWIAGGIHADEVGYRDGEPLDAEKVEMVARDAGETPTAVMARLVW